MKKMNKKLYLGVMIASLSGVLLLGVLIVVFIIGLVTQKVDFMWFSPLLSLTIFGVIQFLAVSTATTLVVVWQMWSSIQDGRARTTPGQAIGYLFIPFYNLYWIFQVWSGFPKDFNNYVKRYQLPVSQLSSGVYEAYPILMVMSVIPVLGIIFAAVGFGVFLAVIAKTCNGVNELTDFLQQRQKIVIPIQMQNPAMARA